MDYVDKIGSLKAGQCYILISMLLDTISLFAFLKNLIQRIYCRSEANLVLYIISHLSLLPTFVSLQALNTLCYQVGVYFFPL